jgi:hypothetical protein
MGVIDPEVLADGEQGMRWVVQQPGYRQWWRLWAATTYSADFRDYVDGLIREAKPPESALIEIVLDQSQSPVSLSSLRHQPPPTCHQTVLKDFLPRSVEFVTSFGRAGGRATLF